ALGRDCVAADVGARRGRGVEGQRPAQDAGGLAQDEAVVAGGEGRVGVAVGLGEVVVGRGGGVEVGSDVEALLGDVEGGLTGVAGVVGVAGPGGVGGGRAHVDVGRVGHGGDVDAGGVDAGAGGRRRAGLDGRARVGLGRGRAGDRDGGGGLGDVEGGLTGVAGVVGVAGPGGVG